MIKASDKVGMDVDLSPDANHGCTLNWRETNFAPATNKKPVEVVTTIDEKAFAKAFMGWCGTKFIRSGKSRSF